jgi:hypothetical protein
MTFCDALVVYWSLMILVGVVIIEFVKRGKL